MFITGNIKISGQVEDRVIYAHTNGDPVMDAPVARVRGDRVILESWTTRSVRGR